MRLERDLTNYSGARLFADEPYAPSEPAHAEPVLAEPQIAAPPSPVAPPALTMPLAANDDWSIPRPSRTGIAPDPATMPADHPRMSGPETREDVRTNPARSVADMLARSMRLAQRYRMAIASALSGLLAGLLDRVASLRAK
jgi:hypothetical protein